MKNKTLKSIGIAFIGLLIWGLLIYSAIAFVKAELNPLVWDEYYRWVLVFIMVLYLAFMPLIVNELKE